MYEFCFESYGVCVSLECDDLDVYRRSVEVIHRSLLGNLSTIKKEKAGHHFKILSKKSGLYMELDGEMLSDGGPVNLFYSYFDSWLRLVVAEHAKDLVFLHCGAVAINGKGILFPGDSFAGKTTLVAALVKAGATYYSDEYAILDADGLLQPFARPLAIRDRIDHSIRTDTLATSLGGKIGVDKIPVTAVMFFHYERNASLNPKLLTTGEGIMKILPQAIPLRFNSEFTVSVLNKMAESVTFLESKRGSVESSALKIKLLIDKL